MILPTKQIPPSKSLLGVGSLLLSKLGRSTTVSALWHSVREIEDVGSFERFVSTLAMLHAMDLVHLENGILKRRRKNAKTP